MGNALGDLISKGEGDYNSYNRGTARGADGRSRIVGANQEIDFSEMTIAEIMRRQDLPPGDPDRLFAVGKFQVIPATMRQTVDGLGVDTSEKYTPENQERMFADYLIREKRPDIYKYITGDEGTSLRDAQKAAALEWASVEDPDTPGHAYALYERSGNRMHTTAADIGAALDTMRNDYKTAIDRGAAPEDAWRSITGAAPAQPARGPLDDFREAVPRIMDGTATFGPRMTEGGLPEYLLSPQARAKDPLADGVLRQGEKGAAVGELQTALNAQAVMQGRSPSLTVDNEFGPATRREVEAFQLWNGMPTTGIADRETLAAVRQAQLPSQNNLADAADLRDPTQGYASPFHAAPTGPAMPPKPTQQEMNDAAEVFLGYKSPTPSAPAADPGPPMMHGPVQTKGPRDNRDPTDPAHPDHADYMKIREAVSKDGRWTGEQIDNISAAALKEYKADPMLKRLDDVKIGGTLPNGDANVFMAYQPWGPDKQPSFHSHVSAQQSANKPAEQSFEQAQQITQQQALAQQQEMARGPDDPSKGGPKMTM